MDLILNAHTFAQCRCARMYKIAAMKALGTRGIPVEIWGSNWEEAVEAYPSLIKQHKPVTSAECVRLTANAKISLNFSHFFKDGAHERVYIAMLNKTLCLTDKSRYLEEKFTHGKDIVFFNHYQLDVLGDDIMFLLDHPDEASQIIQNAYERAAHSRWSDRLATILAHDFASPQIV
jgi:spore maturation protein CgeB